MNEVREIRTLLAPSADTAVLIPGSVVSEVIDYQEPEQYKSGPDWLLGELKWNGWQVPVVHFGHLANGEGADQVPPRSRIMVVKTLSETSSIMHLGFLITGLPKLKRVTPANLAEQEGREATGIFSHVVVEEDSAVIPDLDELALHIEQAVYRQ